MITVPSCRKCNQDGSGHDGLAGAMLGAALERQGHAVAKRLFEERALPTLKKNKKVLRQLVATAEPVVLPGAGGKPRLLHKIGFERRHLDTVVARTIRGLYWRNFHALLPQEIDITIIVVSDEVDEVLRTAANELPLGDTVGDQFAYAYGRAADREYASMWLLQFHGGLWVLAMTDAQQTTE